MRKGFIAPLIILAIIVFIVTSSYVNFSKQKAKNEPRKEKITLTSGEQQVNLKINGTIVYLPSGATLQFEHEQSNFPLPNIVATEKYAQTNFAELSQKERFFLHNGYRYDLKVLDCNIETFHDYDDNVEAHKTTGCTVNVKIIKGPNLEDIKEVDSWNTFISKRVNLSFKFPDYWPVIETTDEQLEKSGFLENVAFSNEYIQNATNDQFGYIFVYKVPNVSDLEGIVLMFKKDYEQASEEFKKLYDPPEFTFTEFGVYKAVTRTQKYNGRGADLTPQAKHYTFVNNGLVYYISLAYTNFADLDPDEQEYVEKIFNRILSTVNFSS